MKMIKLFFVMMLLMLVFSCRKNDVNPPSLPENAQEGDLIDWKEITYTRKDIEYAAEAGMMAVPENRNDPDSRLILIPVTRIPATGKNSRGVIIELPGGPGSANRGTGWSSWFVENYDILMVGYRGVEGSVILDSIEVNKHFANPGKDMLSRESIEAMRNAYSRDARRLEGQGVDLDGYTVLEVVDDIETARAALGYEKINLFSISYGTRLAMIYSWRYPKNVKRSAMVAINPPGRMFNYDPKVIDRQIGYYAKLCADDPACSGFTDDLVETIQRVSREMPDRWLGFPINKGMIRAASFESLSDTASASMVFDVWLAAGKGDYSGMALLTLAGPLMFKNATQWSENVAKAGSADFESTEKARASMDFENSLIGSPRAEMIAAATGWSINTIPVEYRRVQYSETETLMVSGSIDFWTPWEYTEEELLPYLPNGVHVVVSESGHGEMLSGQSEASERLLTSFFDTGIADDSLFVYQPWHYKPGLGFPGIAKIAAAVILLIVGGLILLAVYIIGRLKRNNSSG